MAETEVRTTRYVMASWRAGKFTEGAKYSARASVASTLEQLNPTNIVAVLAPLDKSLREIAIFDAHPSDIEQIRPNLPPDVILEEEILLWPAVIGRRNARPVDLITPNFHKRYPCSPSWTCVDVLCHRREPAAFGGCGCYPIRPGDGPKPT